MRRCILTVESDGVMIYLFKYDSILYNNTNIIYITIYMTTKNRK